MRRIAFINEKGGSCKTTLAVNMAAAFAEKGARVLLCDMDPQGQAGKSLGFFVRDLNPTVFEALTDPAVEIGAAIRPSHITGLDVLCANKRLADFPTTVAAREDRELLLANKLARLEGYDAVLLDAPPSLGLLTINVMLAAQEIVVPVNLTYFAMDGCAEIVETIESLRKSFARSDLAIALVVPTLYRRTRLADEILEKLRRYFPGRISKTVIGYNVKIDEAQSYGKTIWEHAASSSGAQVLGRLADELWRQKTRTP